MSVFEFKKDQNTYIKLATERAEKGDLTGALGFLFSAKAVANTPEVLAKIAELYSDMGALELSNIYWFYYIDKANAKDVSFAFEELAINYFYMDDYLVSSYYFHEKLARDGFLSKEGLDPEIVSFFSGEEVKQNAYHVAYPFDRADYSYELKRGKRMISSGDFEDAINVLSSIPKECLDEEGAGDLAMALLMLEREDDAIEVARESIERFGENVTACCNLSTAYDVKEDYGKREYYYNKAKNCAKGGDNEEYKLVPCAMRSQEHKVVADCLKKILVDRPYDQYMHLVYGIALLNLGDNKGAYEQFSITYKINPEDPVHKFYAKYSLKLISEEVGVKSYLPLPYLKIIPEEVSKEWANSIRALTQTPQKIPSAIKKEENREMLEWGLYCNDNDIVRACVYVLATAYTPYAKKVLLEALRNNDVETSTKRVIVFALVVSGCKDRLGIVDRNFHFRLKPKKLSCEKNPDCALYISAYALCLSRMAFSGENDLGRIAKVTDKVYSKFNNKITQAEINNEELAALILSECRYSRFNSEASVLSVFEISKEKLQMLKKLYRGDSNGEGN